MQSIAGATSGHLVPDYVTVINEGWKRSSYAIVKTYNLCGTSKIEYELAEIKDKVIVLESSSSYP